MPLQQDKSTVTRRLAALPQPLPLPVRQAIVVVLPAPLCPSSAVICPAAMSRFKPSTATCSQPGMPQIDRQMVSLGCAASQQGHPDEDHEQ